MSADKQHLTANKKQQSGYVRALTLCVLVAACALAVALFSCIDQQAEIDTDETDLYVVFDKESDENETPAPQEGDPEGSLSEEETQPEPTQQQTSKVAAEEQTTENQPVDQGALEQEQNAEPAAATVNASADELLVQLSLSEDYRSSFVHGDKSSAYQKYIVLHDTEGEGSASSVVDYWDSSGSGVAAHFIVNKDGSIVQCVPLDKITHHAGFGDTGHNELYGVEDDSRDDKVGTTSIGSWAADYGMNSYSIGIEMVHVGGSGDYPEAQLDALDTLIAYIDAYYGFESSIIDHKAWRTGNSDTSAEFATYLANYQATRTHDGS